MSKQTLNSNHRHKQGFTYIEMMLAVAITGVIMLSLMGLLNNAIEAGDSVRNSNDLIRQARFALQRMVRFAGHSRHLMLPLRDKPATNWPENIREQTVPPSPPPLSPVLSSSLGSQASLTLCGATLTGASRGSPPASGSHGPP